MKIFPILFLLSAVLASGNASADDDISMTVAGMLRDKDVMQAANACLQKHPRGDTIFVENVYPMNHGMVGIVTADTSGRRYDCNVDLGSGKVRSSEPIVEPKGPLFVSIGQNKSAPKGECFSSDPLVIDKQLQGWLLTQTGKCGGTSWNGIATATKNPQNQ
ncbi:hypothetical protein CAter10_0163 [Collimonas arenae]|nr:hypothetical protein [Collimonas arenae]AMO98110.1 hypothetical protein CAter10_0163 [Collimonas arenae]